MCWQVYRDLDYTRTKLREDIRASRERGRISRPVRVAAWALIAAAAILLRVPALAVVGLILFEGLIAPVLASPTVPRELGPLAEWRAPESYRESPESLPRTRTAR
jgi:hypothetical protein